MPPKKAAQPKKPAEHPMYSVMIAKAIAALKDRKGASRQAIVKYIQQNYKVGANVGVQIKLSLVREVKKGTLVQTTGAGASGRFKLPTAAKNAKPVKSGDAKKKTTTKVAKKPAVAKKASTKVAKKPAAKKTVKKAAKSPAKPKKAAKSPAKKAKSPQKKAGKKASKKPAAKKAKK